MNETISSTITTLIVPNCRDGIRIQVTAENRFGCRGPSFEVQPNLLNIFIPTVPTGNGSSSTTEADYTEGGLAAGK